MGFMFLPRTAVVPHRTLIFSAYCDRIQGWHAMFLKRMLWLRLKPGTLTERQARRGSMSTKRICSICEAGCGLIIDADGRKVVSIEANPDDVFSQ
ncbi:MAG: hypothetical protein ACPHE0_09455, partial [Pseudomonadales bacterium]